jgi:hypothetical protein
MRVDAGGCGWYQNAHSRISTGTARQRRGVGEGTDSRAYLYGLALESEWTADAPITARFPGQPDLSGQVLCAWPPHRLSYLLRSPGGPPVYLTWLIRPGPGGSICSLRIDETEDVGAVDEVEDTWLPVLDALRRRLDCGER